MKIAPFALAALAVGCAQAHEQVEAQTPVSSAPAATPIEGPVEVYYVGHSLTSDIPDLVMAMAESRGIDFTFTEQNIPGAPLRWHWDEGLGDYEPTFQEPLRDALGDGEVDIVVLTDSVPRGGPNQEAETVEYLSKFHELATGSNPDAQVYFYETWHHITSGTDAVPEYDNASPTRDLPWRERLDADQEMWERIVEQANAQNPDRKPILLLPAGRMLGELVDAAEAGQIPGFGGVDDLFSDDIHTNHYGKYFVAMIHAKTILGIDPVGLPYDLNSRWGGRFFVEPTWDGKVYPLPSEESVAAMQRVAAG